MCRISHEIYKSEVCSRGSLRGGVGWGFGTMLAGQGDMVRAEKMVLSGLIFARKIARMILIQNILGLMGPLIINMAFMPLYM